MQVTSVPSPNFDERPENQNITLIVLHYTDTASSREALNILCDPASKVSSHYLIDFDGKILKLVDETKRAWHAGVSSWLGHSNVNNYSIGIELQNQGYEYFKKHGFWPDFTQDLKASLLMLLNDLCARYSLSKNHIVGHCHIAPNRKIDPGPHFDWQWLFKSLEVK